MTRLAALSFPSSSLLLPAPPPSVNIWEISGFIEALGSDFIGLDQQQQRSSVGCLTEEADGGWPMADEPMGAEVSIHATLMLL